MAVKCKECHGKVTFCDRCADLIANVNRWRKVAEIEHAKHCTARGDHHMHVEMLYKELANNGD